MKQNIKVNHGLTLIYTDIRAAGAIKTSALICVHQWLYDFDV
jgi:hypothetical protein